MVAFLFLATTLARQIVTMTIPIRIIRNVTRSPITSPGVFSVVSRLSVDVALLFSVDVVTSIAYYAK